MSEADYHDALKALRLAEANNMRELGIKIDKIHQNEEAELRSELEKKHC